MTFDRNPTTDARGRHNDQSDSRSNTCCRRVVDCATELRSRDPRRAGSTLGSVGARRARPAISSTVGPCRSSVILTASAPKMHRVHALRLSCKGKVSYFDPTKMSIIYGCTDNTFAIGLQSPYRAGFAESGGSRRRIMS